MFHSVVSNRKSITYFIIGAALASLFFSLSFVAAYNIKNNIREEERLVAMEKFSRVKSEAELTIRENLYSLDGYIAYIETSTDVDEEKSKAFLDRLLSKRITMLRNIGILEDTTIIWNYPRKGNEAAIGLDLTTIDAQREDVLFVKENLESIFIGPVSLFQGGTGFIIRSPIVRDDAYWGQISIVIDAQKYYEYVTSFATELGLSIAVYKNDVTAENHIFGDKAILNRDGLLLEISALNTKWMLTAEPLDGWTDYEARFFYLMLCAFIASAIIGFLVFYILYTKEQMRQQASRDYLTGLYNRHALSEYFKKIGSSDKAKGSLIMIAIDIDQFKEINDRYGHNKGDAVLVELSKRLKSLNVQNGKIFRLGGDEFLIVADEDASFDNKEELRDKISLNLTFSDQCFLIRSSIGIAHYPKDSDSLEGTTIIADRRMYQDKLRERL